MGVKISGLTAKGATLASTDLIEISQSDGGGLYTSRSVTGANITALVTDANMTTTDITTNNVSTSKHGFAPKSPNDGTKFLDGLGAYDTVKDTDLSTSDVTTNNFTTTKHGFVPKGTNVGNFLKDDGTWAAAGGGLTKFTEAETTAAPNGTVYVDSLTAAAATTNADAVIRPKGNGAFLLNIPDNTTTGGNKRGQYAVDLQLARGANTRVASGNYSFAAGTECTASGANSTAMGWGANATAANSIMIGSGTASGTNGLAVGTSCTSSGLNGVSYGNTNTASGQDSTAIGAYGAIGSGNFSFCIGRENTASGTISTVLGGQSNTASGTRSYVLGHSSVASGDSSFVLGYQSSSFGIFGRQTYSSGQEASVGDAQASKFILRERTTNGTATTLTSDSGAASTTNQVILSNQSGYRFKGTIIGKQSGSTNVSAWDVDGLIVRGANAAATTLVVSNVNLVSNTPAWGTPTLAADTTNGGLRVQCTGLAATNIQWTAVIDTTEVIYA